jgi:hypothetical protein
LAYAIAMKCPACKSELREKECQRHLADEGEFSRIHQEMKGAKTASLGWAATLCRRHE